MKGMKKCITANDIEMWAIKEHILAQKILPELVYKLIHASTDKVDSNNVPAIQSSGYDGVLVAGEQTNYIPKGKSVWELSTAKNAFSKFRADIKKRSMDPLGVDIEQTVFIFATSTIWNHRDNPIEKTINNAKQEYAWKDIRIIDANELARWLESCPSVEAWFSKIISSAIFTSHIDTFIECTINYCFSEAPLQIGAVLSCGDVQIPLSHSDLMGILSDLIRNRIKYDSKKCTMHMNNLLITNISEENFGTLQGCFLEMMDEYLARLKEFELKYEVSGFVLVDNAGYKFELIKVEKWFWDMMIGTADKYDWGNGVSPWHIFQRCDGSIHVNSSTTSKNKKFDAGEHMLFSGMPGQVFVDDGIVIYIDFSFYKYYGAERVAINKRGCWGVESAYRWLINDFIPFVKAEYRCGGNGIVSDYHNYEKKLIPEMQAYYMTGYAPVTKDEIDNIRKALIFCLEKECFEKDIPYIMSKLNIESDQNTNDGKAVNKVMEYLKSQDFIDKIRQEGSNNHLADDLLRCLCVVTDNSQGHTLSPQIISLIHNAYLKTLIDKMKKIKLIEKYKI